MVTKNHSYKLPIIFISLGTAIVLILGVIPTQRVTQGAMQVPILPSYRNSTSANSDASSFNENNINQPHTNIKLPPFSTAKVENNKSTSQETLYSDTVTSEDGRKMNRSIETCPFTNEKTLNITTRANNNTFTFERFNIVEEKKEIENWVYLKKQSRSYVPEEEKYYTVFITEIIKEINGILAHEKDIVIYLEDPAHEEIEDSYIEGLEEVIASVSSKKQTQNLNTIN